jgi:uncharacterized membrane protein
MVAFWIFMLVMALLVPIAMISIAMRFGKNPPKKINHLVGYRTTRSMKNTATWEFANCYCAKLWWRIGWIMLPLSVIAMLFSFGREIDYIGMYGFVVVLVQLAFLILSILPVESALKREFDENGKRRKNR